MFKFRPGSAINGLMLLSICLLFPRTPVRAQVLTADSLALVALYDSTDGENWSTPWDSSSAVGTWDGITISGDRVTRVQVNSNNLVGPIPAAIGDLTALTVLELHGNQLSGSIPVEIGALTNLTTLQLFNNQLTGSIPSEIGSLTGLFSLGLYSNMLSGLIPVEIGNLTTLGSLRMEINSLSGAIPAEIGLLTSLTTLTLGNNLLSGTIPIEIGALTSLTFLSFQFNLLSGAIPVELANLTSLTSLALRNNDFTDLPDLTPLTSLSILLIRDNQFTFEDIRPYVGITNFIYSPQDSVGTTVDTTVFVGQTLNMQILVGGTNNDYQWSLNGVDYADGPLTSGSTSDATSIILEDTSQGGAYILRATNSAAPLLTIFSRPYNVTVEHTPFQIDSLALVALYDSTDGLNWTNATNWLTLAPLATWYGVVITDGRVSRLNLFDNNLSGPLPPALGDLTEITSLSFWSNLITVLPPEIGNLDTLLQINLGDNLISAIPVEIENASKLQLFIVSGNLLTSLPAEIGNLTDMFSLYVDDNRLSDIPDLSLLTGLYDLKVDGNLLTFEDVTPLIGLPSYNFVYAPQDSVGMESDTTLVVGDEFILRASVGGSQNSNQWLRVTTNGTASVPLAFRDTLKLTDVQFADSGTYTMRVTNSNAPLLTIYTAAVNVSVVPWGELAIDDNRTGILPEKIALYPNYPNPFNPTSTIRFDLPSGGDVSLIVHDLLGREIIRLIEGNMNAGYHSVRWEANDSQGHLMPAGIYIARLVTPGYSKSIKMVLLK